MNRILLLKDSLGLNWKEFEKKTGITYAIYQSWVKDEGKMTLSGVFSICKSLNIKPDFLLGITKSTGNQKLDEVIETYEMLIDLRKEYMNETER